MGEATANAGAVRSVAPPAASSSSTTAVVAVLRDLASAGSPMLQHPLTLCALLPLRLSKRLFVATLVALNSKNTEYKISFTWMFKYWKKKFR